MSWFINNGNELSDIAILNIKGADYCCIISGISKSKAINIMYIIDLTKKWNIIKDKNLLSHLKMGEKTSTLVILELKKIGFTSIKVNFFKKL